MNSRVAYGEYAPAGTLDRGVLVGGIGALLLIGAGIAFGGQLLNFIDPLSILIVAGGTFGATLVNYSLYDLRQALAALKSIFFNRSFHHLERMQQLIQLAQEVKRNGLLVLEREARRTDDAFMRHALEIIVDGSAQHDVRRLLENEMRLAHDCSGRAAQVFEAMGNYAPAMGLIGTLIGLIQMLGALQDPAKVGPAMALALVTTFYGALLANVFFLPIAGKIRNRSEEEALVKIITIEGVISLGQQENPLMLEQKLQSFLPAIGLRH